MIESDNRIQQMLEYFIPSFASYLVGLVFLEFLQPKKMKNSLVHFYSYIDFHRMDMSCCI